MHVGRGHGARQDERPHAQAHAPCHAGLPQVSQPQRVHDGGVPVRVDEHQEDTAAIHIHLEDRTRHLAQEIWEEPVVMRVVVQAQGQRKGEEQVAGRQVTHVYAHHRLDAQQAQETQRASALRGNPAASTRL